MQRSFLASIVSILASARQHVPIRLDKHQAQKLAFRAVQPWLAAEQLSNLL